MEREKGFERFRRRVNYSWQDAPLPFIAAEPFHPETPKGPSCTAPTCVTLSPVDPAEPLQPDVRASSAATPKGRPLDCMGAPSHVSVWYVPVDGVILPREDHDVSVVYVPPLHALDETHGYLSNCGARDLVTS